MVWYCVPSLKSRVALLNIRKSYVKYWVEMDPLLCTADAVPFPHTQLNKRKGKRKGIKGSILVFYSQSAVFWSTTPAMHRRGSFPVLGTQYTGSGRLTFHFFLLIWQTLLVYIIILWTNKINCIVSLFIVSSNLRSGEGSIKTICFFRCW